MYTTVSIIGLGYIGLPTAALLASRKMRVIGVDVNEHVVNAVNGGNVHIAEPGLDTLLKSAVGDGYLRAVTKPEPADVFLIAVPTPLASGRKPDLNHIRAAADSIAPMLAKDNLVILESTSPVGTTKKLAQWLADAQPDLSFPQQAGEAAEVHVAYCPERILPGRMLHELVANDRVVGGMSGKASRMAVDFYRTFVEGDIAVSDAATAELCKLAENSFRDVNIAFANELSMICDTLGINIWELIQLANRHPRVDILQPGPGVGGHCIAVDPWFIVDSASEATRLIKAAREVNDHKPEWVLGKIKAAITDALAAMPNQSMADITVACLGLAYKPNVDDLRESPAVGIARSVAQLGCRVLAVEPHIDALPAMLQLPNITLTPFERALEHAQVLCILVGHSVFAFSANTLSHYEHVVDAVGLLSKKAELCPARACDESASSSILRMTMDGKSIDSKRYRELIEFCKESAATNAQLEDAIAFAYSKNNLAYRLGQIVITQYNKSLLGMLTIPFALAKEYAAFKKEKAQSVGRKSVNKPKTLYSGAITTIRENMWGGFAESSIQALDAFQRDEGNSKNDRAFAALTLSQWYWKEAEYPTAYQHVQHCKGLVGSKRYWNVLMLELTCLFSMERYAEVLRLIDAFSPETPTERESLILLRARAMRREMLRSGKNRIEAGRVCLDALNVLLRDHGLAPLALRNPGEEPHFNNIHAPTAAPYQSCPQKVSVLMPAYNAADTIETAIRSVLAQTWMNLELIVVDDASTDETCAVIERLCREDDRIRLVRQETNRGTYYARNIALEYATGDLITVHDGDDWSHPQKIAIQVAALYAKPETRAVLSQWSRVTPELEIVDGWRGLQPVFHENLSSLLFRKSLLDEIGPWDEARVRGDSEFRERIVAQFGASAIATVETYPFLSLSLERSHSLTRAHDTHANTLYDVFGCIYHYKNSYEHWHKNDMLKLGRLHINNKKFYTPLCLRTDSISHPQYDLVVASDFSSPDATYGDSINYAMAAHSLGKKIALLHWPCNAASSTQPGLYDICRQKGMDILTSSDSAKANCLLIGHPPIAAHIPNSLPKVEADRVLVLVDEYAECLKDGKEAAYDPIQVRENLQKAFGSEGTWIPISNGVQRYMEDDARYPKPYPKTWHPPINAKQWLSEPIRWRALERRAPVIGRHGRDHLTKWPADAESLKLAYGVNAPVSVHFMGGASVATKILGYRPGNWTIYGFNALPPWLFLQDLDFLVHFPHQEYIETFGRVAVEGMVAGKVVILPPRFQETFGDAAVYSEATEVIPTVMRYWKSEELYREQAERGRAFVTHNCDMQHLEGRLADLMTWHNREHLVACEEDKAVPTSFPIFSRNGNRRLIQS
jgi:UDP-N-acetyl-D-mannosaminuronic acid dehydrogenase